MGDLHKTIANLEQQLLDEEKLRKEELQKQEMRNEQEVNLELFLFIYIYKSQCLLTYWFLMDFQFWEYEKLNIDFCGYRINSFL